MSNFVEIIDSTTNAWAMERAGVRTGTIEGVEYKVAHVTVGQTGPLVMVVQAHGRDEMTAIEHVLMKVDTLAKGISFAIDDKLAPIRMRVAKAYIEAKLGETLGTTLDADKVAQEPLKDN